VFYRARECVFAFASSRRVAFAFARRARARRDDATLRVALDVRAFARARSRGAPACAAPRSNG